MSWRRRTYSYVPRGWPNSAESSQSFSQNTFPNIPPDTRSSTSQNGFQSNKPLSNGCRLSLDLMAKAVRDANLQYLDIVKDYLQWWARIGRRNQSKPPTFSKDDRQELEYAIKVHPRSELPTVAELFSTLEKKSYLGIWNRAAENIAFLKTLRTHQTPKNQETSKKRALELKACRVKIGDSFSLAEEELRLAGYGHICNAIVDKINALDEYEYAYPVPEESRRGPRFQSKNSTLISIGVIWTLFSIIPFGIAWSKSDGKRGSTEDPDFFVQVQNASMQLFNIFMSSYTAYQKLARDGFALKLSYVLTALGVICTLASPLIYLYKTSVWSSFALLCAAIIQALMTARLGEGEERLKEKES